MRWYVSRAGETVGPVEESQVVEWVRQGMRDAMVRDEAGGPWTPVGQSPFASAPIAAPKATSFGRVLAYVFGALFLSGLALSMLIYLVRQQRAEVRVECSGVGDGFSCTLSHLSGGKPARACWELMIQCQNGTLATASACSSVDPDAKSATFIPLSNVRNFESCDVALSSHVANLKLEDL